MGQLSIQVATAKDAAHIALLGRITFTETFGHLFRYHHELMEYYDLTFSVEKIRNSIEKVTNIFWIARYNDLPVGYAKLKLNSPSEFIEDPDIAQLQKIYVLKDYHDKKLGYQLQEILLEKARSLDFKTIWLSVLEENERAVKFYSKTGFKGIGYHDFHIGSETFNFIAMKKEL